MKIHYSWLICFTSLLIIIVSMGITGNAFTVYFPFIKAEGGYYYTQISLMTTIRCLFSILGMFLVTKYYEKFSLRAGLSIVCLLMVVSFFIYSYSKSLIVYYFATALTGLCYGLGSLIPLSVLLNRWFQDRKAFAIGICTMGTGISTIIFPPFIVYGVHHYGLKTTFFAEAVMLLVITVFVALVLRNSPEEINIQPYKIKNYENKAKKSQHNYSLSRYETLIVIISLGLLGGVSIPGPSHFALLFSGGGFNSHTIALAISAFGVALTVGKGLYGYITDKKGAYITNYVFFTTLIIGLIISVISVILKNSELMFAGMFLMGFGLPPATVGISVWAFDFSDSKHYPDVLKTFQIAYAGGALVFSAYPGILADIFGSFTVSYFSYVLFLIITLYIIQRQYLRKENSLTEN